jgi:integrase
MAERDGTRSSWSTKKTVKAERGLSQGRDGRWAIAYACSLRHIHRERADTVKGNARALLAARRTAAQRDATWCPRLERQRALAAQREAEAHEATRVLFADWSTEWLAWAKLHHKGYATDVSRVALLSGTFGPLKLDEITAAGVEAFLSKLLATRRPTTCNRYRTLLQGMLSRAVRHGLLVRNPVAGIARHIESTGRVVYLNPQGEGALYQALRLEHRALFLVSLNTGLRWSEQRRLTWRCVDFLTGALTIEESKTGRSRVVPMNSLVRDVLTELATARKRIGDPREAVFADAPRRPEQFFPRGVSRARTALAGAGQDPARLDGYTWHANRHTWASRLTMAGVDPRTIMALGGWSNMGMLARYSHLTPGHLQAAVEKLVPTPATRRN